MQHLVQWAAVIALMLLGAMISQDLEGHFLSATVLLLAAVAIIVLAYRFDHPPVVEEPEDDE